MFEDWLFNGLFPLIAYVTISVSSLAASSYVHASFFGIGAAALLLLFIGIHNAWDGVVYHIFNKKQ